MRDFHSRVETDTYRTLESNLSVEACQGSIGPKCLGLKKLAEEQIESLGKTTFLNGPGGLSPEDEERLKRIREVSANYILELGRPS
jgi:hypothetical protein